MGKMTAGGGRLIQTHQFQLNKRIPYGALNAFGIGLVPSPSAHVGSWNHGGMVLIDHGKRHDAYAFMLETLVPFSGVPWCGQLGRAALFKPPTAVVLLFGLALGSNANDNLTMVLSIWRLFRDLPFLGAAFLNYIKRVSALQASLDY